MATKYWVGGTGDWSDSAHWSASSGGSGGAGAPSWGSDDVRFDANSFSADGQRVHYAIESFGGCASFVATGVTHSVGLVFDIPPLVSYQLDVFGDFIIPSNFSITSAGANFKKGVLDIIGPTVGVFSEVDLGGNTMDLVECNFMGNVKLISDYSSTGLLGFALIQYLGDPGTFDANNFDVTVTGTIVGNFINEGIFTSGPGTIMMGSGTWTAGGIFHNHNSGAFPTIDCGTSTLIAGSFFSDIGGMIFTDETDTTFYNLVIPEGKTLELYRHLIVTVGGLKGSGNLTFNNVTVEKHARFDLFSGSTTTVNGTLHAVGDKDNIIGFATSGLPQAILYAGVSELAYVRVSRNHALGDIYFDDLIGGIDAGNNTNWLFPVEPGNSYLQNVFMVGSDTDGDVLTFNVGKSDNEVPIYFELETQDIEFGNRAHIKKIANQLAVFTRFGAQSTLQAKTDMFPYKDIPLVFNSRVTIGDTIDLEGHYVTFKWFGSSSTTSPVFEGLYIEDVTDQGITHG